MSRLQPRIRQCDPVLTRLQAPEKGRLVWVPVDITENGNKIEFRFERHAGLGAEIKAFEGARWNPDDYCWQAKNSPRNRFQLSYLKGENPYERFSTPLPPYESKRPLYDHQKEMCSHILTRRQAGLACEPGTGKSLVGIEVIEQVGGDWIWVSKKSGLEAVKEQISRWGSKIEPRLMTYDRLVSEIQAGMSVPDGVFFDESHCLKTETAQRTKAARTLADKMRADLEDPYIICASGTPAPKSPADWFSPTEILVPGFLREGTFTKFKQRLALMETRTGDFGDYPHLMTWKDNPDKCAECGRFKKEHDQSDHKWRASINEVALLAERLAGLWLVKMKRDCLDLPEKVYSVRYATPTPALLALAKSIVKRSDSAIKALTELREISDGALYQRKVTGQKPCVTCKGTGTSTSWFDPENPDDPISEEAIAAQRLVLKEGSCDVCSGSGQVDIITRVETRVDSPKDAIVKELLDEFEDHGRIIFFGAFTSSVNHVAGLCKADNWSTIRITGAGWLPSDDLRGLNSTDLYALFQSDDPRKIAIVADPGAAGAGLTLTKSSVVVFYSNSFLGEGRSQSEDRIHRPSMNLERGAQIIDIVNLPSDLLVMKNLKDKKRLESLTLGDVEAAFADRNLNGE